VPTLAPGGPGGKKAARDLSDRSADPTAKLTFPDHWNEADVRGALYAAQGKACAYCGCLLPRNDRGDVDHFRPKGPPREDPTHGGYWWLAYEFDNYLLSCSTCNSICKSDRFPLRPRARRITFQHRARLLREARLLLDPARDPVEQWLRVEWQDLPCWILPSNRLHPTYRAQVIATLEFFRINTDPRLIRERIEAVDDVAKDIEEGRTDDARARAIRFRPHSLVARQVLTDLGHDLPSPREELGWLLADLLKDWDFALQILEYGPSEIAEKQKKEVLWSLASLWHDPPEGMQAEVQSFLVQKGVLDFVEEDAHLLSAVRANGHSSTRHRLGPR
jgi:uncharacterized protein (TIGR02646 family)